MPVFNHTVYIALTALVINLAAAFGLGAGVGVRLVVGLAAGLTVGLVAAAIQAAWLPFAITRCWFAATGRLPLGLMSFLRDAHERGVLRQVGGVYQFRHAELQRRLVGRDDISSLPGQHAGSLQLGQRLAMRG